MLRLPSYRFHFVVLVLAIARGGCAKPAVSTTIAPIDNDTAFGAQRFQ